MSVEYVADPSRTRSILPNAPDEIIIFPDFYVGDPAKAEKDVLSRSPDKKQLPRLHPKKRIKVEVPRSVKESHDSGLTGDSLDGNPLNGTTLD